MTTLTDQPIEPSTILADVQSPLAGAVVLFLGTTRELTAGRRTVCLDYECYPEMALKQLQALETEARGRWPLVKCSVVHRLGRLGVGETSVAVAVSSAHRQVAFEAGQWLIDSLKQHLAIWKRENWEDGSSDWVHPMADAGPNGVAADPGQRCLEGDRA